MVGVIDYHCINYAVYDTIKKVSTRPSRRGISKVETKAAVDNLESILMEVDHILIDRGDLSTEIGLNKVPIYQKHIIDKSLFHDKKVFLATQFLKSMEFNPVYLGTGVS